MPLARLCIWRVLKNDSFVDANYKRMSPCKDVHEFLIRYAIKFDPTIGQQSVTVPSDLLVDEYDKDMYDSLMNQEPKKPTIQFIRL